MTALAGRPAATSRPSPARRPSRRRPGRAGRHAAAREPRARHGHHPNEARQGGRGARRLGGAAARRRRHQGQRHARLPALLEQLERAVTAAGGVVHWARDAAEANGIVAGIARDAGATEVVKVKSMATQEIELNEALRQEGIDVWETDLAEMIVQLGHDLPSHILVPAIHRNRSEIRDIFREEMGKVGRPAPDGPDRRARRAGRGRPTAPAREVPARPGRRSRAPTSASPRPAPSPSSSRRATAGCA